MYKEFIYTMIDIVEVFHWITQEFYTITVMN